MFAAKIAQVKVRETQWQLHLSVILVGAHAHWARHAACRGSCAVALAPRPLECAGRAAGSAPSAIHMRTRCPGGSTRVCGGLRTSSEPPATPQQFNPNMTNVVQQLPPLETQLVYSSMCSSSKTGERRGHRRGRGRGCSRTPSPAKRSLTRELLFARPPSRVRGDCSLTFASVAGRYQRGGVLCAPSAGGCKLGHEHGERHARGVDRRRCVSLHRAPVRCAVLYSLVSCWCAAALGWRAGRRLFCTPRSPGLRRLPGAAAVQLVPGRCRAVGEHEHRAAAERLRGTCCRCGCSPLAASAGPDQLQRVCARLHIGERAG